MKIETQNIKQRRLEGEFFTPIAFANKGLEYLKTIIGNNWWQTSEYRLWDMAAGTGNLEHYLPKEAHKFCYLSTIYQQDVEYCQNLFTEANCFQYDYLNDDVDLLFNTSENVLNFDKIENWKLPLELKKDLQNTNLKWIILINPPFATSQTAGTNGESKAGVSNTKIRKIMHNQNLGEVSRELFSQFIFRIKKEFENKIAFLALFSKIKYLNSTNDQKFREQIINFVFEKGFIFSSINFSGTSRANQFPVGFLIWNLNKYQKIETQNIVLDIFNENIEEIGKKQIIVENKKKFLNKWIKRPSATIKFPPVGSAINLKPNNKDKRDRVSENFLASLMCAGNNLQCQNQTALFSMPSASAGAFSVTPQNFDNAMIIHAVRRILKANWINDRDQLMQPIQNLTNSFITDCTVWNIFSNSNQTVTLKNVIYENEIYQIKNNFFPFQISELQKWNISDNQINDSMQNDENRFLTNWFENNELSNEAMQVLNLGKEIYKIFFQNLNQICKSKYKIETWDAGWWQIRNSLKDMNLATNLFANLKILHNNLKHKILTQVYYYKFIDEDSVKSRF